MFAKDEFLKEKLRLIYDQYDGSVLKHLILTESMPWDLFIKILHLAKSESKNKKAIDIKEVLFDQAYSPKNLFNFLRDHADAVILMEPFTAQKILKSPVGLNILKGAICSTLDGEKWKVHYGNSKPFIFKGSIIMLVTSEDINWSSERYFYLKRDQAVIDDLEARTIKYNDFTTRVNK